MRASVLLMPVLGVLGIPVAAYAQTPIRNTFPESRVEPTEYPAIRVTDPSLRSESIIDLDDDRPSLAIGNEWRVEAQSDSHFPVPTMKSRDEGLYVARPINEHWTFQVGAWRSKLQWTGNETSMRSSYIGFQFERRH